MGMNTAIKNGQILDNAFGVLGIEFMAAAQALDFREFNPGKGSNKRGSQDQAQQQDREQGDAFHAKALPSPPGGVKITGCG